MALVRRGTSPGAAFALHGNRLRRDLNDLTDERIKPLRVGASVGAECLRLPSIDRYQATAKVHDFVLRHHGTKGIDTQRNPYGSEGWGFESLRARSVLRRTWTPSRCRGRSAFLDEPAGQRPVATFQSGRRGRPEGCSVQLICEGMEPLGWEASLHPSLHRCRDGLRARDGAGGVYRGG